MPELASAATRPCESCRRPIAREPDGTWFCGHCAAPSAWANLGSHFGGGWGIVRGAGWVVAPLLLAAGGLAGWAFWSIWLHELLREGMGLWIGMHWCMLAGLVVELAFMVAGGKLLWRLLHRRAEDWFPFLWITSVGALPVAVLTLMIVHRVIH